ncbi:MAG: AAA family ATPase, partial [Parahaliea sp.]
MPPRISTQSVQRIELLTQLHNEKQCRLLIVSGSAGMGKTTLMAQWRLKLIGEGNRICWISLSRDENIYSEFCANLIGAMHYADLPLDSDLALYSDVESDANHAIFSKVLLNSLATMAPHVNETYVMIDDLHHINDRPILALLQILIDSAPPNLHFVIGSRTTPPLRLGRLRAMGQLCEIESSALAFSLNESRTFLNSHLPAPNPLDIVHSVHELADGWPTGLQLIALSLNRKPRRDIRLRALMPSREDLSAFLSEDVVDNIPAEQF